MPASIRLVLVPALALALWGIALAQKPADANEAKAAGDSSKSKAPAESGEAKEKAEANDGFRPLFNGKDLTGWKTTGNWVVEEGGVLALKPRQGEKGWTRYDAYLTAEGKFKNYVLDLEYKYTKGGNSGVYVRIKDMKNPVATGIEAQVLDSFGKKEPLSHHDHGGIVGTVGPSKNMSKPAGEWNRMVLTLDGARMKVKLNGEQIIDLELDKSAVKDRPLEGFISIQDHGQPFWVRNIRIKELP